MKTRKLPNQTRLILTNYISSYSCNQELRSRTICITLDKQVRSSSFESKEFHEESREKNEAFRIDVKYTSIKEKQMKLR